MGALIGGWSDVALAAVSMALVIGCSHQCQSINLVARYLETSNPLVPPLSVSQPILNVPYFISRYGQGRAGQAGTTNLHSTYSTYRHLIDAIHRSRGFSFTARLVAHLTGRNGYQSPSFTPRVFVVFRREQHGCLAAWSRIQSFSIRPSRILPVPTRTRVRYVM